MHLKGFAQLLSFLVQAKGNASNALARARHDGADEPVLLALDDFRENTRTLVKTAIAAGTTADSTWAAPLLALQSLQSAWFASLRSVSILDAILAEARRVPANQQFGITSLIGTGFSGMEAQFRPITKLGFTLDSITPTMALALLVVTDEVTRFDSAAGQALVEAELRNAVGKAADLPVITALLHSLTPIASVGDARHDLANALSAVPLDQFSKPMIFTSPDVVKQMAMLGSESGFTFPDVAIPGGGSIAGMPLMGVDGCHDFSTDGDILIVVDANQVGADAGALELAISNQATIQMADNSSGTSPVSTTSMFQTDSLAIRANRYFNIGKVRDAAAAVVKNVSYTGSP